MKAHSTISKPQSINWYRGGLASCLQTQKYITITNTFNLFNLLKTEYWINYPLLRPAKELLSVQNKTRFSIVNIQSKSKLRIQTGLFTKHNNQRAFLQTVPKNLKVTEDNLVASLSMQLRGGCAKVKFSPFIRLWCLCRHLKLKFYLSVTMSLEMGGGQFGKTD